MRRVLSYVQRRGVSPYRSYEQSLCLRRHIPPPIAPENRPESTSRFGDRRPRLSRYRLPESSWHRPVPILSPSSASRESHSAQAHAPQRPPVYATASSLFTLERRSIPVLVVDSTTGSEGCATSTLPDEAPSGGRVMTQQTRRRCCAGNNCETVGCEDVGMNRPAPEGSGAGRRHEG